MQLSEDKESGARTFLSAAGSEYAKNPEMSGLSSCAQVAGMSALRRESRNNRRKIIATIVWLVCAVLPLAAQQRGGGGFGGGGFGGGGFGGGGGARTAAGGTTRPYYNNGTVGEAMISSDPETRRLIVITDEETGQYVSQVVTNLDRPKPQVLIKVVFLEVTHNDTLDLGLDAGYRNTYFNNSSTGAFANIFGISGLNQIVGGTNVPQNNNLGQNLANFQQTLPGGLYQIMGSDYQATLRAIATAGKTEVLSRPSVLARNNQPATIVVGQSVPLITSTTYSGLNNLPISSYTYTSVGIILRVTPFINSDNMVEMIVSPQISQLEDKSQWVQTGPGIFAPVIDSRSADTVVVTPDGQTVIIGGLMQKSKQHAETKVPLLGDIPWLGNLFKRRINSDAKTELIIFLTPHIVMAPTQLAGLTASEQAQNELPRKAFTEKELNQFLDNLPNNKTNKSGAMTPDMEKKARDMLH